MKSIPYRAVKRLERSLLKMTVPRPRRDDLCKFGSSYGGWVVPTSLLSDSSICYCVGVGEDVSFDIALIDNFGCKVFAFDPTPRAIQFAREKTSDVQNYQFHDIGLWSEDRWMRFYEPKNPSHVSHSVVNLQGTSRFFEAQCRRLSSLMRDMNHDRLDLLKLDIEGAEHEVIESILDDQIQVRILCVEFDQPNSILKIGRTLRKMTRTGYTLVSVDGWNCTFVQDNP